MQRLFSTREELKAEANRVLQQYANKRVNDMMYQLRVDAVKLYFFKVRGEKIKRQVAVQLNSRARNTWLLVWNGLVNQIGLLSPPWDTSNTLRSGKKPKIQGYNLKRFSE